MIYPSDFTGLRPHSKDSMGPPYTMLSWHNGMAEIITRLGNVHLVTACGTCSCPLFRSGLR